MRVLSEGSGEGMEGIYRERGIRGEAVEGNFIFNIIII